MSLESLIFLIAVALYVYANVLRPLLRRRPLPPGGPVRADPQQRPPPVPSPGPDWGRGDGQAGGAAVGGSAHDRLVPDGGGEDGGGDDGGRRAPDGRTIRAPRAPRAGHAPPGGRARHAPGRVPRAADLRRLAPADLRDVVVLTTVLGPCRALDDARRDPTRPG